MRGRWFAACITAALGATALIGAAQAAPFVVNDNYIGANAHGYGDVIANPVSDFQINSISVERKGADLQVVVNTTYNPNINPGTGAPNYGTGLGDLFFGTNMSKSPSAGTGYGANSVNDQYTAGRFNYAFDITNANHPGTTGTGTLVNLKADGSEVKLAYLAPGVSGTFRDSEAVQVQGTPTSTGLTGNWVFDASAHTLTFLIGGAANYFGNNFFIAWAMTCANDVIYADINLPPAGNEGQVPLPAGFLLMGTVLLGAGGVARWRKRRRVQAVA